MLVDIGVDITSASARPNLPRISWPGVHRHRHVGIFFKVAEIHRIEHGLVLRVDVPVAYDIVQA
jgi:hypothetical protein